jgi:hypothetical protein
VSSSLSEESTMARNRPSVGPAQVTRRRMLLKIGVGVFVLLDIGLVAFALSTGRNSAGSESSETNVAFDPLTPTPSPTPSAPPSRTPSPAADARYLFATSPTIAWRATQGSCGATDAVIESSTDGGASWTPHPTGALAVHQVLSLEPVSDTEVTVVGKAGADCATGVFSSFTGGDFWQTYPAQLASKLYFDAAEPTTLTSSGAELPVPCDSVAAIESWNGQALVLCKDVIYQRDSTSNTWLSISTPGAISMSTADGEITLAAAGVSGCAGVAIQTAELPLASASPTTVGCIADLTDPGSLAISQAGTAVWVWSGTGVRVSSDSGVTW